MLNSNVMCKRSIIFYLNKIMLSLNFNIHANSEKAKNFKINIPIQWMMKNKI